MADNEKLMRQSLQAGFNGGWLAACMAIAEMAEQNGGRDFAKMMREMAKNPQRVEIVEVKPDWHCDDCGHDHAENMGGICVGCPCPNTAPAQRTPTRTGAVRVPSGSDSEVARDVLHRMGMRDVDNDADVAAIAAALAKAREDGAKEMRERAARWHEERAALIEREMPSERDSIQVTASARHLLEKRAATDRSDAAAILALATDTPKEGA